MPRKEARLFLLGGMAQDQSAGLGHERQGQPLDLGRHPVPGGHAMDVVKAKGGGEVRVPVGAGEQDQNPAIGLVLKVGSQAAPGTGELDASPFAVSLHLAVGDDEDEGAVAGRRRGRVNGVENLGRGGLVGAGRTLPARPRGGEPGT